MSTEQSRATLRAAQASLVRALIVGADVPPGWDRDRVKAAAHALSHKRARAAAVLWPSLPEALGEEYIPTFMQYARVNPLPARNPTLADGRRFVARLEAAGRLLPDEVLAAAVRVDMNWRSTRDGLERRWLPVLIVRKMHSGKWVIAVGPSLRFI